MISRVELLAALNDFRTEENADRVEQYITVINGLDDKALEDKLKELKIRSVRDVKKFVTKNISREQQSNFINLNDLVSYGVKDDTIHIHVVPPDVHSMMNRKGMRTAEYKLIDALEQIQTMLKTDKRFKRIKQVYAVSPIVAGPVAGIFNNLSFDVKSMLFEEAKKDKELSRFYKRFEGSRNGKDPKYFGSATLPKQVIFSKEWDALKAERKQALTDALQNNKQQTFASTLENGVNTEITAEEIKLV